MEVTVCKRRWGDGLQRSRPGSLGALTAGSRRGHPDAPLHAHRGCGAVQGGLFRLGHARAQDRPWQGQRCRPQQPLERGVQVGAAIEAVLEVRSIAGYTPLLKPVLAGIG